MASALAFLSPALNSTSTTSASSVLAGTKFNLQALLNADALVATYSYGSSNPITYSIHTALGSCGISQFRAANGDVCEVNIPAATTAGTFVVRATYSGNPAAGAVTLADFTVHVCTLVASLDKNIVLADGTLTATASGTFAGDADTTLAYSIPQTVTSSVNASTGVVTVGVADENFSVRVSSDLSADFFVDLPFHATLLGTDLAVNTTPITAATGLNEVAGSGDEILQVDDPVSGDDGTVVIVRTSASHHGLAFFNSQFQDTDGDWKDFIDFGTGDGQAVFMVEKFFVTLSPPASSYKLICIERSATSSAGNKF